MKNYLEFFFLFDSEIECPKSVTLLEINYIFLYYYYIKNIKYFLKIKFEYKFSIHCNLAICAIQLNDLKIVALKKKKIFTHSSLVFSSCQQIFVTTILKYISPRYIYLKILIQFYVIILLLIRIMLKNLICIVNRIDFFN